MFKVEWRRIRQVLEQTPGVIAAWAFGSGKEGVINPGSDLDVAVLFEISPSLDTRAELRARLQEELHFDDIDLLILNNASSITRFEAVSGRLIYERSIDERVEYVSLTAREYEYDMAFLQSGLAQYRATGGQK